MDRSSVGGEDLARLRVRSVGALRATGSVFEPFELVGPDGEPVVPVGAYLRELQGRGRSESTQRSYAFDLLRWFRFLLMALTESAQCCSAKVLSRGRA